MKVVCVKRDHNSQYLTLNKIYEVLNTRDAIDYTERTGFFPEGAHQDYFIVNDHASEIWYDARYFKTMPEMREERINNILRK